MSNDNYNQMTLLGGPPKTAPVAPAQVEEEPGSRLKSFLSDYPAPSAHKIQTIGAAATPSVKKERKSPDQMLKNGVHFGSSND